jgi:predicted porin
MKKLVLMSALLAAAGVANAQSSVSVYGRLDNGIRTVDGHKDGRTNTMSPHGLGGSRWGIEGSEDLGGGTKSSFRLESTVHPDTGAGAAALFDRQSFISISNKDWGTIKLGRDNTFGLDALFSGVLDTAGLLDGVGSNPTRINATVSAYDPNPLTTLYSTPRGTRRLDNLVKYTHSISGFNFGVAHAFGEVAGDTKKSSTQNYSVGYTQNQFSTVSTYQITRDAANLKMEIWNIGAKYNFGQFALLAAHHELKADAGYSSSDTGYFRYVLTGNSTDSSTTKGKVNVNNVGLVYNFAPKWTYTLAYYNVNQKEGVKTGDVNSVVTHVQYDLSKRTSLYGIVDYQKADSSLLYASGAYKTNQTGFTAGMRHIF